MEDGRIAIPSIEAGGLDGQRSGHFGHCDVFTLVDVKGGEIKKDVLLEEGDTFVIVMEGQVELSCDKESFVLNKGDSFYCKGQKRPQKITNIDNKLAVLLWVQSK